MGLIRLIGHIGSIYTFCFLSGLYPYLPCHPDNHHHSPMPHSSLSPSPQRLSLSHLSVGYPQGRKGHKVVLSDINATLYAGELTCILGANGIGKSTLLRTLSGFQRPLSGHITLESDAHNESIDLQRLPHAAMARMVSIVLTGKPEVQNLQVHELVALGRSPYTDFWGNLKPEDEHIVKHAMEQVGILHLHNRQLNTLSDGERQKTMIAKAMAQSTPIILLDEPTAFLDFPSKVEMLQLLQRLAHESQKLILLSTHDLELALQLADRLWLVEKDRPLKTGTPQTLAQSGDLKAFIDSKHLVFEDGRVKVRE